MGKIINYDFENKKTYSIVNYNSKDYKEGYEKGVIDARTDIMIYIEKQLKDHNQTDNIIKDIMVFFGNRSDKVDDMIKKSKEI